jgi:hypothetical protein
MLMAANLSYSADNKATREQLKALLARLSEEDMNLSLGEGWTVKAMLAHLAFWDRRHLAVLEGWQRSGMVQPVEADPDSINEAVRHFGLALTPQAVGQLALEAAEAIDGAVEQVGPELAAQIEAIDFMYILWRARHRREHLGQIKQALQK